MILVYFYKIKSWKGSILRIIWILPSKLQTAFRTCPRAHLISRYIRNCFFNLKSLFEFLNWFRLRYLNYRSFLNEVLFENIVFSSIRNKSKFSKWLAILLKFLWFNNSLLNIRHWFHRFMCRSNCNLRKFRGFKNRSFSRRESLLSNSGLYTLSLYLFRYLTLLDSGFRFTFQRL